MTRKGLSEALHYYLHELGQRFPNARTEVIQEPMGGFDVEIRVEAPSGEVFDILDATVELTAECLDKYQVSVLAIVNGQAEPIAPTGELRRK